MTISAISAVGTNGMAISSIPVDQHLSLNRTMLEIEIQISGGTSPYVMELYRGTLPDGITTNTNPFPSVTTSFFINGTPTAVNFSNVQFIIQDADGGVIVTDPFLFNVYNNLALIVPSSVSLSRGSESSYQLMSTGGRSPVIWEVKKGSLPDGITLSESGLLSGITDVGGTSEVTFTAEDQLGDKLETDPVSLVVPSIHVAAFADAYV